MLGLSFSKAMFFIALLNAANSTGYTSQKQS